MNKGKGMHVALMVVVFGLCGAMGAWAGGAADMNAVQPPMVAKHLLVPETDISQGSKTSLTQMTRVTFTGVINSAKGKKALLETGSDSKDGASPGAWYGVGDTVGPYVVKEIDTGAVVLEGSGQTLRLPLYGPDKDRPEPVQVAAGPLPKGQDVDRPTQPNTDQQEGQGQPPTPFGPTPGKSAGPGQRGTPSGQTQPQGGGANPLQQALEKARQGAGQGSSQNPFPPPQGSGSNPFMEMMKKKGN
ncbi:MAG: hypothetical protein ACUVWY_09240 [Desulfosoma sp.]|uniref:hypothetical protein n=1 Tax=Desulfosoma sp. TaxID=2603217 RepID=UPI00404B578A